MAKEQTPEEIFFLYAFPCSNVLVDTGSISKERYEELKRDFEKREVPTREILEDTFKAAFRRLRSLASEMNLESYWDIKVMNRYWRQGNHNENIDRGDGNYAKFPEVFRDFCKVNVAKVIDLKDPMLIVEYNGQKRPVFSTLIPDAKVGDKVRIHHAYAIEKI